MKTSRWDAFDPFENLDAVTPIVQTVPGWQKDISGIRRYEDLPYGARKYTETLEKLLHAEISLFLWVRSGKNIC